MARHNESSQASVRDAHNTCLTCHSHFETMKRHSQDPTNTVDASFKRIRLSTSPGELRLDADLNSMPSFRQVDYRHWVSTNNNGALLERQFGNPTTFCLHLSRGTQVWMEFPRQYPHEPPLITKVVHPVIDSVICSIQPAMPVTGTSIQPNTTIVYNQWSAVRRLDEFLAFLIDALKHHSRALVTPTQMMDDADETMQDVVPSYNFQQELSPNRFDQGYPKTSNHHWHNVMPRGEPERTLMNSDSY